jgi:RNA polymerase sigma factor (sigma-70 family)
VQPSTGVERRAEAANALSFELFFEAERRRLFRAIYLMTGSVQEAEEIVQDAFLRIWERWDHVQEMTNPAGYLYRAAMNLSRSRFRRVVRAARIPPSAERDIDPFEAADARDAVVRALAGLAPRQRQALVLTALVDLSADDAADMMRVKASTVRSLAAQAHDAVRNAMEDPDA